jgi:hypothetical protein
MLMVVAGPVAFLIRSAKWVWVVTSLNICCVPSRQLLGGRRVNCARERGGRPGEGEDEGEGGRGTVEKRQDRVVSCRLLQELSENRRVLGTGRAAGLRVGTSRVPLQTREYITDTMSSSTL